MLKVKVYVIGLYLESKSSDPHETELVEEVGYTREQSAGAFRDSMGSPGSIEMRNLRSLPTGIRE